MFPPGAVLWTCLLLVEQPSPRADLPFALPNQSGFLCLERNSKGTLRNFSCNDDLLDSQESSTYCFSILYSYQPGEPEWA